MIFMLLFFSGCYSVNEKQIDKKVPSNQINNKKIIENKECTVYKKNMKYALSYISSEFENGYFKAKDMIGAKAQFFLIKNRSESVFSKNINKAESFYILEYNKAKKKKCNIKEFIVTPLETIETKLK